MLRQWEILERDLGIKGICIYALALELDSLNLQIIVYKA